MPPKAKKLSLRDVGGGGVNLVKGPLHLEDNELTQAQNAEFVLNEASGGVGVLSKRGGLSVLNGSALAGSVTGLFGLPLETTYTRTLYAARQSEDSNTFMTTTNGTTWADTASPIALALDSLYGDNTNVKCQRRAASIKNFIVYASNAYTQDTDNPEVAIWDGTNALTMTTIPIGPSSNGSPCFVITDVLRANGTLYIAVSDPGGSAPDLAGRVLSLDMTTGVIKQVASGFGNGTGEMTGGSPACLAFYQNQLWVGLNGNNTTNGIGKVVKCFPGISTAWTSDIATLRSHITSLAEFKGALYATTRSSTSAGATISQRSPTAGTWSTVATSGGGADGNGHYGHLIVYSGALYCVEYHDTTPIIHIVTSTDGSSWSTSRDVDGSDSGVASNYPGGSVLYGSDLYFSFRSTTGGGTNGFIMRRASGAWTKVVTDNFNGSMAVLLQKT